MFWKLEEARLLQIASNTSAANALSLYVGAPGVPAGKVWVILGASYQPSVAETQVVSFEKYNAALGVCAIFNPASLNLNPAYATFIEQGMEYLLFPGDYIGIRRVAATAGSTMSGRIEYIEIDLPLYTYDEPQIVVRQKKVLSSIRTRLAGGSSGRGGPGGSPGPISHGGGGGTALPV